MELQAEKLVWVGFLKGTGIQDACSLFIPNRNKHRACSRRTEHGQTARAIPNPAHLALLTASFDQKACKGGTIFGEVDLTVC